MAITVQAQNIGAPCHCAITAAISLSVALRKSSFRPEGSASSVQRPGAAQEDTHSPNLRARDKTLFASGLVQTPQIAANPFHLIEVIRLKLTSTQAWEYGKKNP
jgi:hypothetical protein